MALAAERGETLPAAPSASALQAFLLRRRAAILAVTGTKAAVGPPWFNRYTVPLALVLVLLSGIGPVIAWRRATLANARRNFLWPTAGALVTLAALLAFGVTGSVTALIMFVFATFVVGVLGQELWRGVGARRAMTSEGPARAVVSLVRRNRRRYGGYTVHLGMAVLFVGVAASSAFQHARDVRLAPGQTASVGGYQVKYVKPTARVVDRDGGVERIALGAQLEVRKHGDLVGRLHTERGYYPSAAPFASGGLVRGLFEGEATSEVGMKAGPLRDVWTVIQPDPEYLNKVIDSVAARTADKPVAQQERAVSGLIGVYERGVFPAQFRLLVSPLVAWIWLGGLIVFAGGLIALWPAPDAARGRVRAGYAARVAQDLDRA